MVKKFRTLTIGDGLITMNPSTNGPLRFVTQFDRKIGGAELNFAIGSSRLGLSSRWISRLGDDEFGRLIYNYARGEGIDTSHVELINSYSTPLNFKEIKEDGSGRTFYYRDNSPILTFDSSDIKQSMFTNIDVLHLSGVFLSVMKNKLNIIEKIVKLAKQSDVIISFDPNLRLKIWELSEAKYVYEKIFPYIDIFLTGLDEINLIADISTKNEIESFAKKYNIKDVVIKKGAQGSMLYRDSKWYEKEAHKVHTVDTVGAGDGFDAGYIYGFLHNYNPNKLLNFSNAIGALVTTVSGDNEGLPYLREVEAFINDEKILER